MPPMMMSSIYENERSDKREFVLLATITKFVSLISSLPNVYYFFCNFAIKNPSISFVGFTRRHFCTSGDNVFPFHSFIIGKVSTPGSATGKTMASSNLSNTLSICISFSSGANVHVLYTSVPPGLSDFHAESKSSLCVYAISLTFRSFQYPNVFGFLITNRASELQG